MRNSISSALTGMIFSSFISLSSCDYSNYHPPAGHPPIQHLGNLPPLPETPPVPILEVEDPTTLETRKPEIYEGPMLVADMPNGFTYIGQIIAVDGPKTTLRNYIMKPTSDFIDSRGAFTLGNSRGWYGEKLQYNEFSSGDVTLNLSGSATHNPK